MSTELGIPHDLARDGIKLRYYKAGDGPSIVLCHGFPDTAYGWRHQIRELAADFCTYAVDMRGYGESSCPDSVDAYELRCGVEDILELIAEETTAPPVLVGHDWGAAVAWQIALRHPETVKGIVALNLPFQPWVPYHPLRLMDMFRERFDYQFYFQEPGIAERELDANPERTVRALINTGEQARQLAQNLGNASEVGTLLHGIADRPANSLLTSDDIEHYVEQFTRTGFGGGLNWYRNHKRNWAWSKETRDKKVCVPALMITAGLDPILPPEMARGLEDWVPRLKTVHLASAGHYPAQECPNEVSEAIRSFATMLFA